MIEKIAVRIKQLQQMDEKIRNIDDEEWLDYWLTYGVPDEACPEQLEDIAKDDNEFKEVEKAYNTIMKNYTD